MKKNLLAALLIMTILGVVIYSDKHEKKVYIQFDDAYSSVYEIGLPVLSEYGYSATVFVPGDFVGKNEFMDWEELKDLEKKGWEIGGHGYYHFDLTSTPLSVSEKDIKMSYDILIEKGFSPISFGYPAKIGGDYLDKIVQKYYPVIRDRDYLSVSENMEKSYIIRYLERSEDCDIIPSLVFHHIAYDEKVEKAKKITCPLSLFHEILDHLKDNGYESELVGQGRNDRKKEKYRNGCCY